MKRWLGLGLGLGLLAWSGCGTTSVAPEAQAPASAPQSGKTHAAQGVTRTAGDEARLAPLSETKPVNIVSDRLAYTQQGQVTVFQGHVQVRQESARLEAPYLEVRSDDGLATAKQGVRLFDPARGVTLTAQELEYKETLSNARARGQVNVYSHDEQNQALRIQSEKLAWDSKGRTIRAEENVKVMYRGATATAQVMDYAQAKESAALTSPGAAVGQQPRIEQDGDVITGDTIELKLKERSYTARGKARAEVWPKTENAPGPRETRPK